VSLLPTRRALLPEPWIPELTSCVPAALRSATLRSAVLDNGCIASTRWGEPRRGYRLSAAPSALGQGRGAVPGLTAGPTHYRRFAPRFVSVTLFGASRLVFYLSLSPTPRAWMPVYQVSWGRRSPPASLHTVTSGALRRAIIDESHRCKGCTRESRRDVRRHDDRYIAARRSGARAGLEEAAGVVLSDKSCHLTGSTGEPRRGDSK